ncbi:MAG: IS3 family transposase [Bacilli bacterium]
MQSLCECMNISRSGYYKWLTTREILNRYELDRIALSKYIKEIHNKHLSYGYRRINAIIRRNLGWYVSDNLIHKICKYESIRSKARHYSKYQKPGLESIKFPNLINNNWDTERPFEKIATDTTTVWFDYKKYDWTYYLDVFNNEIVGSDIIPTKHGNNPKNHYRALTNMLNNKIKRGYEELDTIFHSDQGSLYSSLAFANAHKDYTIIRSMSRIATPTDNPIIESINGWIKKEIYLEFNYKDYDNVYDWLNDYIDYYNTERPAYSLNYKTPIQYKTELGF